MSFICDPNDTYIDTTPQAIFSSAALLFIANMMELFSQPMSGGKVEQSQQHLPQNLGKQYHPPSADIRLKLFTVNTGLLVLLCIAFALCMAVIPCTKEPIWWMIVLIDILPFVSACVAWLRTVVSCVMMRFAPESDVLERYWPSYIFLAFPMLGLMAGMRAVMGQADGPNRSGTANDELAPRRDINEEELGLMQGEVFDGEDDQTVYSPRTSASGDVDESLPDKAA